MNDSLIGKVLLITCKQIKYTDRGVPYGIADVKVWLDDNDLLINPSPDPEDDREIPEYALTIPEECN